MIESAKQELQSNPNVGSSEEQVSLQEKIEKLENQLFKIQEHLRNLFEQIVHEDRSKNWQGIPTDFGTVQIDNRGNVLVDSGVWERMEIYLNEQ